METNERSNQQGQNFSDMENTPRDMATPNAENKPRIDIDKINDDFLANDRKTDSDSETETNTASQQFEREDLSANDRGRFDNFTDTDNPEALRGE